MPEVVLYGEKCILTLEMVISQPGSENHDINKTKTFRGNSALFCQMDVENGEEGQKKRLQNISQYKEYRKKHKKDKKRKIKAHS